MATTSGNSSSLRELLYRAKVAPEEQLLTLMKTELDLIFKTLEQPGINQDFRSDLLKIISSAIDIVKTMSSSTYNVDDVLQQLAANSRRFSFILSHVAASRPRTQGFGLVHRDNGKILPSLWLEETEASKYITSMRDMGALASSVDILPVEIVSRYIPRPRALEPVEQAPEPFPQILRSQDGPLAPPPNPPFEPIPKTDIPQMFKPVPPPPAKEPKP